MPYAYLVGTVVLISILGLLGTAFHRKHAGEKHITSLYNLALCTSACLTWGVIYALDFSFSWQAFPYSVGFGVCFGGVLVFLQGKIEMVAVDRGSPWGACGCSAVDKLNHKSLPLSVEGVFGVHTPATPRRYAT